MLDQASNESSISSCHSSILQDDNQVPRLIAIEECLPTFAEATIANLPRVLIPNDEDPPSFHLSNATHEAKQDFPPVSPRTTEILLRTDPDIKEAIHTITYRLIAAIHRCTLATSQELDATHTRKQQLH